jgi:hypothetical protein
MDSVNEEVEVKEPLTPEKVVNEVIDSLSSYQKNKIIRAAAKDLAEGKALTYKQLTYEIQWKYKVQVAGSDINKLCLAAAGPTETDRDEFVVRMCTSTGAKKPYYLRSHQIASSVGARALAHMVFNKLCFLPEMTFDEAFIEVSKTYLLSAKETDTRERAAGKKQPSPERLRRIKELEALDD